MTFTSGVDAVGAWPNRKVYFFRDAQYIRFDIANNRADPGYPKPIAGGPADRNSKVKVKGQTCKFAFHLNTNH